MNVTELIANTRRTRTPFVWFNPSSVIDSVADFRAALPDVELFYAVKCNPERRLLRLLAGLGAGFEVASPAELCLARELVPADRVMCLHPMKSPAFVRELYDHGVNVLAVDCEEELLKVADAAPGSGVLVRVAVSNAGSRHRLDGKFGCRSEEAVRLLRACRHLGLAPLGTTMHVGTQCGDPTAWTDALGRCRAVLAEVPVTSVMSLGGGFPVRYRDDPTDPRAVLRVIAEELPTGFRLTAEPGRALVATAGTLVGTVIGLATRPDGLWAFLDAGIHQGLYSTQQYAGGFRLPVRVEHPDRPPRTYTLAGPTCDGSDVIARDTTLPELEVGDRLGFGTAGAYAAVMATKFNGFDPPRLVWGEGGPEAG